MRHAPAGYTYEGDMHCPQCAEARFGVGAIGVDREGNEVGAIAPWDEIPCHGVCGDCGEAISAITVCECECATCDCRQAS